MQQYRGWHCSLLHLLRFPLHHHSFSPWSHFSMHVSPSSSLSSFASIIIRRERKRCRGPMGLALHSAKAPLSTPIPFKRGRRYIYSYRCPSLFTKKMKIDRSILLLSHSLLLLLLSFFLLFTYFIYVRAKKKQADLWSSQIITCIHVCMCMYVSQVRELKFLQRLRDHPNIVRLIEHFEGVSHFSIVS